MAEYVDFDEYAEGGVFTKALSKEWKKYRKEHPRSKITLAKFQSKKKGTAMVRKPKKKAVVMKPKKKAVVRKPKKKAVVGNPEYDDFPEAAFDDFPEYAGTLTKALSKEWKKYRKEHPRSKITFAKFQTKNKGTNLVRLKHKRKPSERNMWMGRYMKQYGVSLKDASDAYKKSHKKK
jgi:hypothetical protein